MFIDPYKLLGLNEKFAYVSIGSENAPYDPRRAAVELLKAKDWRSVVSFIEDHALNSSFCWYVDDESFGIYAEDVFSNAPEFDAAKLGRPLMETLTQIDMPDYIESSKELDCLTSIISIRELIHIRDTLRGVVLMAAVALSERNSVVATVSTSPQITEGVWVLGEINPEIAGFTSGGLLDLSEKLDDAYNLERSHTQGIRVVGNEYRVDTRLASVSDAVRATCGNMAAIAMGQLSSHRLNIPALVCADYIGEDDWGYRFNMKEGFTLDHSMPSCRPWWEPICDEVVSAILKGRVSICEYCGTPFIAERKGASTCSPSCRTGLCIKRKAKPAR